MELNCKVLVWKEDKQEWDYCNKKAINKKELKFRKENEIFLYCKKHESFGK